MENRNQRHPMLTRRTFLVGAGVLAAAGVAGVMMAPRTQDSNPDAVSAADSSAGDARDDGIQRATTFAFDTVVDLAVYGSRDVLDAAVAACARYDALFSMQREGSDVWRINHAQGAPVQVDPDTADLISRALALSAASEGAFDITIGAVSSLWDFKAGVKPSDEAIKAALPHVGWRNVSVEGNTVTLADPQAAIDLGGIAKGWIADALASLYRSRGVESGLVNLGGNVFAVGEKPSGAPWVVGIRDPNVSNGPAVATVEVRDRSVVTSGLYERHFTGDDGVDYYHILDPATGYPAKTDLRSDTVITHVSFDGDGLSTTLFVFGSERAIRELEANPRADAIFMTDDGSTSFSSGFGDYHYTVL